MDPTDHTIELLRDRSRRAALLTEWRMTGEREVPHQVMDDAVRLLREAAARYVRERRAGEN